MSIDEATPQDWDELRKKHPAILEKYEKLVEEECGGVTPSDVVNNPHHYNAGRIECIEAIKESMSRDAFRGYLKGNCIKYLWRYEYKEKDKPTQDLEKAQWYLNLLISEVE